VAIDLTCTRAAREHTLDIVTNIHDLPPDHSGSDGRSFSQRLNDLGIVYTASSENNSWASGTTLSAPLVDKLEELLFKDFTANCEVPGRGHRRVILNGARNLVGVGVLTGIIQGRMAGVCTQDYITNGTLYLTGVVYSDMNGNDFYSPGEGLRGVTIQATSTKGKGTFTTTTFISGGYTLSVPPDAYTVTAFGGPLPSPLTQTPVLVGDRNVKVDFSPDPPIPPPPDPLFSLLSGAAKQGKDGVWGLALTKVGFSPGSSALTQAQYDALAVVIDGVAYFDRTSREASAVKLTRDAAGGIVKLAVISPAKDKLSIDLTKRVLKLTLKRAPGFDPAAAGDFDVAVDFGTGLALLTTRATVVGTKASLVPAVGVVSFD
jgi:hypothetical protein